jgi:hypothetical protein
MTRWFCLERELLSVISFDAAGARKKSRLDWMIRRGMFVECPWQEELELWECELFKFEFENVRQCCERRDGVISDVSEWYLGMRLL